MMADFTILDDGLPYNPVYGPVTEHVCIAPDYCICRADIVNDLCPQHGYQHLWANCTGCGRKMRMDSV